MGAPSPMSHVTLETVAVAVTVHPAAEALRVIGPQVLAVGCATHIQFGMPTRPIDPGRDSGTIPIVIARNCMLATACWASTRGLGGCGGAVNAQYWIVYPARKRPEPIVSGTRQS
jgi:hypothetical protein